MGRIIDNNFLDELFSESYRKINVIGTPAYNQYLSKPFCELYPKTNIFDNLKFGVVFTTMILLDKVLFCEDEQGLPHFYLKVKLDNQAPLVNEYHIQIYWKTDKYISDFMNYNQIKEIFKV
jgi:hypothetical protein